MFSRGPSVHTAELGLPPRSQRIIHGVFAPVLPPLARLTLPLLRLPVEPPRLDQRQCPAGLQLTSAYRSVRHSPPITSRRTRLIWSVTRRRHCAICQTPKTNSAKCVPSTAINSPSVTGSIATQLYKHCYTTI